MLNDSRPGNRLIEEGNIINCERKTEAQSQNGSQKRSTNLWIRSINSRVEAKLQLQWMPVVVGEGKLVLCGIVCCLSHCTPHGIIKKRIDKICPYLSLYLESVSFSKSV